MPSIQTTCQFQTDLIFEMREEWAYTGKGKGVTLQTIFSTKSNIDIHTLLHFRRDQFTFDHTLHYVTLTTSRGFIYQGCFSLGASYAFSNMSWLRHSKIYGDFTYSTLQGPSINFKYLLQFAVPGNTMLLQRMHQPVYYTSIEVPALNKQTMATAIMQADNLEKQNASLPVRNVVMDNVNTLKKIYDHDKLPFSPEIAEQAAYLFWTMSPKDKNALLQSIFILPQFNRVSEKLLPAEIRMQIYKNFIPTHGIKFTADGLSTQPFTLTVKNQTQHYAYMEELLVHIGKIHNKKNYSSKEKKLIALLNKPVQCKRILQGIERELFTGRPERIYQILRLEK